MKIGSIGRALVRYFRPNATSVSPQNDNRAADGNSWRYHATGFPVGGDALDRVEEAAHRVYGKGDPAAVINAVLAHQGATFRVEHIERGKDWLRDNDDVALERARQLIDDETMTYQPDLAAKYAVKIESGAVDERPGIQPPADDAWTWERWQSESDAGTLPGWSFVRFGTRTGPVDASKVTFVLGIVRGAFGIWNRPLGLWRMDGEGGWTHSEALFSCVTHLRSGVGIGLFANYTDAAAACDLAERVCPDWQAANFDGGAKWAACQERTEKAWYDMGIVACDNAQAHDHDGRRYLVMGISTESVAAGKPEKLS